MEVVDKADEDLDPSVDVVEDLVEACRGVKDMKETCRIASGVADITSQTIVERTTSSVMCVGNMVTSGSRTSVCLRQSPKRQWTTQSRTTRTWKLQ